MSDNFNFATHVIEASQQTPVLVDFWAEWCAPCRVLGPVLEKLADKAQGAWQLVKVNTEEHPQLASEYGIRGIPAVKLFSGGEVIADFVGALPEIQITRWLEEHLPTEAKTLFADADEALRSGHTDLAEELLRQVVQLDDTNHAAKVKLGALLFPDRSIEAAGFLKDVPIEDANYQEAQNILTLTQLQAMVDEIAARADDTAGWQNYLAGIQAFVDADYESAIKKWIDAIIIDKTTDDDGPRKACVALFAWLGQQHDLTKKYHRQFTSALF